MLRGRSESDSVLPSGDSAYASTDPSCAGMLLERVILGALLTGLDAAVKRTTCESLVRTQVLLTPGGSSDPGGLTCAGPGRPWKRGWRREQGQSQCLTDTEDSVGVSPLPSLLRQLLSLRAADKTADI